jgi:hypothetical protein
VEAEAEILSEARWRKEEGERIRSAEETDRPNHFSPWKQKQKPKSCRKQEGERRKENGSVPLKKQTVRNLCFRPVQETAVRKKPKQHTRKEEADEEEAEGKKEIYLKG